MFLVALLLAASSAYADPGLTGEEIPDIWPFDLSLRNYKSVHPRGGGVLAVSKNGCIVYQRGFGGVPENAPMRIMSIEKAFTAAAIRDLVQRGALSLDDYAFDLAQTRPGILKITPRPYLVDGRLRYVTIDHLLNHQGGWYQNIDGPEYTRDPMFRAREIAGNLQVASPPARTDIASWVLGKRLNFTPGKGCSDQVDPDDPDSPYLPGCGNNYSNFGYMVLGLIIEQRSGMTVAEFVHNRLLAPEDWVPSTDLYSGRTLPPDRGAREPAYLGHGSARSVFDLGQTPHLSYAYPSLVNRPDGVWHLESMQGHGNLVSGTTPLVRFLDTYVIQGPDFGKRRDSVDPIPVWVSGGGLDGTSSAAMQSGNGINIVAVMNDRDENDAGELVDQVASWIEILGSDLVWPTRCVDGFWVRFGSAVSAHGSHESPFGSMENLLSQTLDGSKVQLHPNTSTSWKGTITKRMLITAPLGPAKIGEQ